ncbi:MAG: ATPase domain-containing protein [Anaerolineae bacterium]|jgi:circadian clock protein KaiC
MSNERVKTDVKGLDDMLNGGFLPQSANLIEGPPGTGKTTLGMQFIYNGIQYHDEPGLILTFEEFPQQYYRDAESFGWDFRRLESEGKLKVIMTSPGVSRSEAESVGGRIETLAREMGARRILVDSISHFDQMAEDALELRSVVFGFINALKREGLTSVLTRESPVLLGGEEEKHSIAYVVDSYIMLRYVEIESAIRKALLVLKLRGSDHAKDIRQFEITDHGIEIMSRFEGQEGIMSGSPRRMAEAFDEAFKP